MMIAKQMATLKNWNVEDEAFWEGTGKAVANRNLWISIPCLLAGFGVWMQWGVLTVQMLNLGFPYAKSELFSLAAIAGLSGATLRIPSTFFIRIAGGRNTLFFIYCFIYLGVRTLFFFFGHFNTFKLLFRLNPFLIFNTINSFYKIGQRRVKHMPHLPKGQPGNKNCRHHTMGVPHQRVYLAPVNGKE